MFTDSVVIQFRAGNGGNGVVAWRREKFIPKGGPAGGNGGAGGSIYLQAESEIYSLESLRNCRIIKAQNGADGGGSLKQGKKGSELIIKIPCGTLLLDAKTKLILADFTEPGQKFLLCQGGRGGKGNNCFKSPTHQAPNICTPGTPGQESHVELELKLIADVGLVGFPNAGKSTLMSQITHIPVKIAAYPFTTLYPNLSYIEDENYSRILIADIPGIIENAHLNKGLGISFLKHIERTSVLVYVIDISGFECRDPYEDFSILRKELQAYNPELLQKPFLVVLNKIDKEEAPEQITQFRNQYPYDPETLFEISAQEGQGISSLIEAMSYMVKMARTGIEPVST